MLKGNQSDCRKEEDKNLFVSILEMSGLSESDRELFHSELEKRAPDFHQSFLEFLGLSKKDIKNIRSVYIYFKRLRQNYIKSFENSARYNFSLGTLN